MWITQKTTYPSHTHHGEVVVLKWCLQFAQIGMELASSNMVISACHIMHYVGFK